MADLAARAAKPHINKCPTKLTIFYNCFRNSLKKYTCLFIGTKLVEKVEEKISDALTSFSFILNIFTFHFSFKVLKSLPEHFLRKLRFAEMAGSECQKGFEKTFSKLKRQSKTTATTKNTKSEKRRPLSIIYIITNIPTKSDLRLLRYDQKFTIHMFQSDNNCFFFNLQLHVLLFRICIFGQ